MAFLAECCVKRPSMVAKKIWFGIEKVDILAEIIPFEKKECKSKP